MFHFYKKLFVFNLSIFFLLQQVEDQAEGEEVQEDQNVQEDQQQAVAADDDGDDEAVIIVESEEEVYMCYHCFILEVLFHFLLGAVLFWLWLEYVIYN